ncbi:MAG TPA: SCP2 sterol-binding domain-containing protein [Acidimicrobiales bacterium]
MRYLSAEWFEWLREHAASPAAPGETVGPDGTAGADGTAGSDERDAPGGSAPAGPLVLRQVVTGGPDGDVRYDVVVSGEHAVIDPAAAARADLTFTSDYDTAAAIASGRMSTHAALSDGRLRVSGNAATLAERAGDISAIDPVPARLRAETEY